MAAHAQLIPFPPPPQHPVHPPTQPHLPRTSGAASQLTLLIREREGRQPGGGGRGGLLMSSRRSQSRERSHKQQKGGIPAEPTTLSHIVTDSERSLAE